MVFGISLLSTCLQLEWNGKLQSLHKWSATYHHKVEFFRLEEDIFIYIYRTLRSRVQSSFSGKENWYKYMYQSADLFELKKNLIHTDIYTLHAAWPLWFVSWSNLGGGWIYNGYRSAIHCMNSYFIFQNKENNLICIHPLNTEGNLVPMFFLMNNLISSKYYDTALHTSHHEFQFILQEPMSWV